MALNVAYKINKLNFFYSKKFLDTSIGGQLCNTLLQPHFDYACSTWYQRLKYKIQITQNKFMCFSNS